MRARRASEGTVIGLVQCRPYLLFGAPLVALRGLDVYGTGRGRCDALDQLRGKPTGEDVRELLLDAGYFDDEVIDATLTRDISLLCPEGQWLAKTKEEGATPRMINGTRFVS